MLLICRSPITLPKDLTIKFQNLSDQTENDHFASQNSVVSKDTVHHLLHYNREVISVGRRRNNSSQLPTMQYITKMYGIYSVIKPEKEMYGQFITPTKCPKRVVDRYLYSCNNDLECLHCQGKHMEFSSYKS